jgi:hypothetical protein
MNEGRPGLASAGRRAEERPTDAAARLAKPSLSGPRHEADGLAALCVTDDLGGRRRLAAQGSAELADHVAVAGVEMDLLADERRATAVGAATAVGCEGTDTATQQGALEACGVAAGPGADGGLGKSVHEQRISASRAALLPYGGTALRLSPGPTG